jgi:hypothetical protein
MRTEAAVLVAVLCAASANAEAASSRFELNVAAEVTLVGLTFGVRPELLFRPGDEGTVSRLRLAVGVLAGPDQLFVPLSLGYRAQFRQAQVVQPLVGVGVELQHRFVSDLSPVRQFGAYLEFGVGFAITQHFALQAILGADLMVLGGPGFGFGPRLGVGWRW